MKKFVFISLILTIICLFATNKLWLVFKPMPVSFNMFGNGTYKVKVVLNKKDNNEFKKVKEASKEIELSNEENEVKIKVKRAKFPKRLKLVITHDTVAGGGQTLYVSDFQLNKEKIKIKSEKDFSVKNTTIKVADNKLYITPINNNDIEIIYNTPLTLRSSISFKFHIFLFFFLLPSLLLYFSKIFNYRFGPSIIAFAHFSIANILQIDKYFFDYPEVNMSHLIFIKILSLIFLLICYNFISFVYKKIKEDDEIYIRGLKLFSIYFILTTILLLLVWPGLWAWDDIATLIKATTAKYYAWQHILSSFEYMLALEILPFIGGIIIIRNFIISACFAFATIKLENAFNLKLNNKFFDYLVKIIPFLLFPVLRYQLSGYRMGLCVYFELVMLCMLVCAIKDKLNWSWLYSISFIVFSIICIAWRSENFIYIPMIGILLLVIKEIGSIKKRLLIFTTIIIGIIFINSIQFRYLEGNYELLSTYYPALALVRISNEESDASELKNISKILKISIIRKSSSRNWRLNIKENYTKEDYKQYKKSLLLLALKYPKVVLKERLNMFLKTSGVRCVITSKSHSSIKYMISFLSNDTSKHIKASFFTKLSEKNIFNKPININLRNKIAYLITLENNEILYKIIWNILPPMFVIMFVGIISLIKNEWANLLICSTLIVKMIIIFLTAPGAWPMYYLSFYLIGYVIIFYSIISFITHIRSLKHA